MELGAGEAIGIVGGLAVAGAAIWAVVKSGEANRIARDANFTAIESRKAADEANRISNVANTLSNESNQIARESNAIARAGLTQQQQAEFDARTARLVHRYSLPDSVIPSMQSTENGRLGIRLLNEGP